MPAFHHNVLQAVHVAPSAASKNVVILQAHGLSWQLLIVQLIAQACNPQQKLNSIGKSFKSGLLKLKW